MITSFTDSLYKPIICGEIVAQLISRMCGNQVTGRYTDVVGAYSSVIDPASGITFQYRLRSSRMNHCDFLQSFYQLTPAPFGSFSLLWRSENCRKLLLRVNALSCACMNGAFGLNVASSLESIPHVFLFGESFYIYDR